MLVLLTFSVSRGIIISSNNVVLRIIERVKSVDFT